VDHVNQILKDTQKLIAATEARFNKSIEEIVNSKPREPVDAGPER
jgi:hypothetical protein